MKAPFNRHFAKSRMPWRVGAGYRSRLALSCARPRRSVRSHSSPAPAIGRASPTISKRSEEHTSELQSLMRISYAVFCLKKKKKRHEYIKQQERVRHIM